MILREALGTFSLKARKFHLHSNFWRYCNKTPIKIELVKFSLKIALMRLTKEFLPRVTFLFLEKSVEFIENHSSFRIFL